MQAEEEEKADSVGVKGSAAITTNWFFRISAGKRTSPRKRIQAAGKLLKATQP